MSNLILDHIKNYKKKTPTSGKIFSKSLKLHINGVSHNIRYFNPYPFVVKSSLGKNLVDVDNNKYTDYWMGHWSLILGHGQKNVKESIKKQIDPLVAPVKTQMLIKMPVDFLII